MQAAQPYQRPMPAASPHGHPVEVLGCMSDILSATLKCAMPPLQDGEYDAAIPTTEHGLLICVEFVRYSNVSSSTVFARYAQRPDGSKGPSQLNNLIRNVGDRIIAVDGVSTANKSFPDVLNLIRDSTSNNKFVHFRFFDVRRYAYVANHSLPQSTTGGSHTYSFHLSRAVPALPPMTYSMLTPSNGHYRTNAQALKTSQKAAPSANVKIRTMTAPQAPNRGKDGKYRRPAGRSRRGMEWNALQGMWVVPSEGEGQGHAHCNPQPAAEPNPIPSSVCTSDQMTHVEEVSATAGLGEASGAGESGSIGSNKSCDVARRTPVIANTTPHNTSTAPPSAKQVAITPSPSANLAKRLSPSISSTNVSAKKRKTSHQIKGNKLVKIGEGGTAIYEDAPRPGTVCPDLQFYSTLNNETALTVANKLGCDWRVLASVPGNITRYGRFMAKSRFQSNTLLQIPTKRCEVKVRRLLPSSHKQMAECDRVNKPGVHENQGATPSDHKSKQKDAQVSPSELSAVTVSDESISPTKITDLSDLTSEDDTPSNEQVMAKGDQFQRSISDEETFQVCSAPRRSGRSKTSTIIHIDGHAVKAANNYVVKGGTYAFNVYEADEVVRPNKDSSIKMRKAAQKKGENAGGSRKRSAESTCRMQHNEKIKARIQHKEQERKLFMARNIDVISPFLETKVEQPLRSLAVSKLRLEEEASNDEAVYIQPDLVQAEMRDYQLLGLSWMVGMHRRGLPMILGDEMGLGKTLQTISLLCYLRESEGVDGPSLVICPLSVLYSWCNELTKWAPGLKFLRFHSSDENERELQRQALRYSAIEYDVVVTTYEMAKSPHLSSLWRGQYFNYVILDEGHIIKESKTQISTAVRKLHYENALILTGTPLQNNLVELWAILNFLYPEYFTRSEFFADAFDIGRSCVNTDMLHKAHKLLNLFMLRRLKVEVERLLPKKIETKVVCPLSNMQVHWYKGLLLKDINLLAQSASRVDEEEKQQDMCPTGPTSNFHKNLRNLIVQLRKCCLHPFLFDGAESNVAATSVADLIAASGKLAVLDKLLRSLYQKGHRVVIFSQFVMVLNVLEDYCSMRGWKFCRFDGSTARAKRNYIINKFNAPGSDDFIFLMSTRSGGMGINMQTADTCILFDSDWNPQPDIQAQARVHRIGQKKTVHVYRLVSGGTIEERMVERAEKKLFLDQMVNRGTAAALNDSSSGLSTADLLATLRFGSNAVFGDSSAGNNKLPTNEEIEVITDRNRTENTSVGLLKGGASKTAKDFDAEKELTATTKFGGVDFKAIRDAQTKVDKATPASLRNIACTWAETNSNKRVRKSRIVMLDGAGSGYGDSSVPVLASNNYDLQQGESSVFDRELTKKGNFGDVKQTRQIAGKQFGHQETCQVCGDGGELICCNGCPVCVHEACAATSAKVFDRCSHHKCSLCGKNNSAAGGILFACQSCPNCFCEDCLPKKGVRLLGACPRFQRLGFDSTRNHCYIHCTKHCEQVAVNEFGWSLEERTKQLCPAEIDVSHAFGEEVS